MSTAPPSGSKSEHDWLLVDSLSQHPSGRESKLKSGLLWQNWIEASEALLQKFRKHSSNLLRYVRATGMETVSLLLQRAHISQTTLWPRCAASICLALAFKFAAPGAGRGRAHATCGYRIRWRPWSPWCSSFLWDILLTALLPCRGMEVW
jgi:hypothetical protein